MKKDLLLEAMSFSIAILKVCQIIFVDQFIRKR